MSDKRAVKVGDMVNGWNLSLPEYDGCEFKAFSGSPKVQITKVPDPKPEIPDEPRTRGTVVTIEGDDEFIALRFTGADYFPDPFLAVYTAEGHEDSCSWQEIVSRAAGRKIIVHKTVDPNEAPNMVATYAEWTITPEEERKKYKWRDNDGDLWIFNDTSGTFEVEGWGNGDTILEVYFPLIRDKKIG